MVRMSACVTGRIKDNLAGTNEVGAGIGNSYLVTNALAKSVVAFSKIFNKISMLLDNLDWLFYIFCKLSSKQSKIYWG